MDRERYALRSLPEKQQGGHGRYNEGNRSRRNQQSHRLAPNAEEQMSSTSKHHHELTDGEGKCSVPMWCGGLPADFCNEPAYGFREKCKEGYWRDGQGIRQRWDGKYDGYVPGLACCRHGGPTKAEMAHKGDPCEFCGVAHDDVAAGPCPKLIEQNKANRS